MVVLFVWLKAGCIAGFGGHILTVKMWILAVAGHIFWVEMFVAGFAGNAALFGMCRAKFAGRPAVAKMCAPRVARCLGRGEMCAAKVAVDVVWLARCMATGQKPVFAGTSQKSFGYFCDGIGSQGPKPSGCRLCGREAQINWRLRVGGGTQRACALGCRSHSEAAPSLALWGGDAFR